MIPHLLAVSPAFPVAVGVTGCAFFAVGASRSLVVDRGRPRAGAGMLAVDVLAAGVAFGVGRLPDDVA